MMLEIMGQGCARGLANPELLDAVAQQRLELWVTMQALRHVRHARIDQFLRITVGTDEQVDLLLKGLAEVLQA